MPPRWVTHSLGQLCIWTTSDHGLAGFAGYWQFRSVQDAAAEAAKAVLERHGVECYVVVEKD